MTPNSALPRLTCIPVHATLLGLDEYEWETNGDYCHLRKETYNGQTAWFISVWEAGMTNDADPYAVDEFSTAAEAVVAWRQGALTVSI